ncbi:transcriptional regulator [gamma proteobacterium HTCC5015]|nr:transcriptional regulator [gamma proteobacterium HTCC5015]
MAYRETQHTQARKRATHARLFAAAQKCLVEGGFAAVQMQTVAERAGLATGTLYRYYKNRAELCCALFRHYTQREVDTLKQQLAEGHNVAEQLEHGLHSFVDRALTRPQLAHALIAEPVGPELEAERLDYRERYAKVFAQVIEQGIARQELPAQNATISAEALVGTVAECLIKPASQGVNTASLSELRSQLTQFCLRAIGGGSHE